MKDEFTSHHPDPEPVKPEMRFLDLTDPLYLQQKSIIDGTHCEIPKRLGMYDPDIHIAELIRFEVGLIAPFEIAILCRHYAYMWCKEKNPHCLDLLAMACEQFNFVPPPSVTKLLAEAATLRIDGYPSGTANKLLNENAKHQALRLMANLIYSGATLKTAASKAAQWHHDTFPDLKQQKASSLEVYYVKEYRKLGIEKWLFEARDARPEINDQWSSILNQLPLAKYELEGVRRR